MPHGAGDPYGAHGRAGVAAVQGDVVLYGNSKCDLASAEGNDAADGIVRGNPYGHTVSRHDLDSKSAHSAAQLGEYLMALVALHTVETTAVDRHNGPLHIN